MDTTDNTEAPKRRLEDQAQPETLDWSKPDAPAVPAAAAAVGRIPLRAVASMSVSADGISFFATPAAHLLEHGHYMLPAPGAEFRAAATVKDLPAKLRRDHERGIGHSYHAHQCEICQDTAAAQAPVAPAAPAVPHQYRKLTSELTLKELAAEFFAVSALGGEVVISAGVCQKLFEAMTTAPAVPVIDAPRVEDELRAALDRLRLKLQFATPSIDKIHEHGADGPLEEAWQIYYDEVMPALAAPIARQAQPTDLSKQLRAAATADVGMSFAKLLIGAAEEIERYYGGMLAWKQTAEKKDRDWNEARMARENDRAAARAQPTDRDAVSVLRAMIEETNLTYKRGILHDAIRRIEALSGSTTEGA